MTEQSNISDSYHPTAILLPFYLNGTLSDQERQEVDIHISECSSCQQELEEMRSLRTEIKTYFSTLPSPPTNVFSKVKSQILAEAASDQISKSVIHTQTSESFGAQIQEFLQSIFATQWAPALAMCLIIGQAGLLFLTMSTSPTSPLGTEGPAYGPVIERSIPQAPTPDTTHKLRIAFEDQTTEHTVRTVIQSLKGRIVDGPTSEGMYIIEVPKDEAMRLTTIIQNLVSQKDVIRLAEPLTLPKG